MTAPTPTDPPTPTDSLATSEDYAKYVGTPPANINDVLAEVSDEVRRFCGWHIAPQVEQTLTLDGPGGWSLMLPTLHLVDVVALTNGGAAVDVTALEWSENGYMRGWWTNRLRGITATIVHGHTPVPPSLVRLVCDIAARAAAPNPRGVSSEAAGGRSISYLPNGLLRLERDQLAPWKLPSRP